MAELEIAQGNLPNAVRFCKQALAIRGEYVGVEHPETVATATLCRRADPEKSS